MFEKQYSWKGDSKKNTKQEGLRYLAMLAYAVMSYYVMRVFLCAALHLYYNVDCGERWYLHTSRGVNVFLRALGRKFPPTGAVLELIYALSIVFILLGIGFHYVMSQYFGGGKEEADTSHGSAHFASLDEIKKAGLTIIPCNYTDPKSGEAYAITDVSGVVLCNYTDEKTGIRYLVMDTGSDHNLMDATTRSGKGVAVIEGTDLQWKDSLLVIDIKGENWLLSSGYRARELGQYCLRFDPTDPGDEQSIKNDIEIWVRDELKKKGIKKPDYQQVNKIVDDYYTANKEHLGPARWNPLADVQIGTEFETAEIQIIAQMIADPKGEGLKDYWAKAGFELLTGAITYECYKARKEGYEPSLRTVLNRITSPNAKATFTQWVSEDLLTDREATEAFLDKIQQGMNVPDGSSKIKENVALVGTSMKGKAENELSGVVSSAKAELSGIFLDDTVVKNMSNGTFSIDNIVNSDRPVSVYLTVPPSDQARMTPVIRLFIVMTLLQLTGRMVRDVESGNASSGHLHRLLLMLDEFPQLKKLEQVQSALAQMAGYGLKACVVIQSLTQLRSIYGKDENVSSNCNVQIAFAPNDDATAQELSNMCGKKTESVGHMSESISGSFLNRKVSRSISYSEHERPLLYPDEVRRLPAAEKNAEGLITKAGKVLVFSKGFPPIMGEQALYFQNAEWLRRSRLLPPLISVNTKERVYKIRKAIEDWQRQHPGKSVEELIAVKAETPMATLEDKVIKKWYNPALRRDPKAVTSIMIEEENRKQRMAKRKAKLSSALENITKDINEAQLVVQRSDFDKEKAGGNNE